VADDENGESMKPMGEVPLDSRDEGKHAGRNDLFFVKKKM